MPFKGEYEGLGVLSNLPKLTLGARTEIYPTSTPAPLVSGLRTTFQGVAEHFQPLNV